MTASNSGRGGEAVNQEAAQTHVASTTVIAMHMMCSHAIAEEPTLCVRFFAVSLHQLALSSRLSSMPQAAAASWH
jgi:hypothetical protein